VILLLVVGIGVLGFAALRRNTAMQQVPYLGADPQHASASTAAPADATTPSPAGDSSATSPAGTGTAPPAGTPPTVGRDVAATAGAGTTAAAPGTGATPGRGTVPPGTAPTDAAGRAGRGAVPAKDSASTPPPATPASAAVVSFDNIRVLIADSDNKGREREAVLQLGGGRLSIVAGENGPSIASLPYANIKDAFYSRSKQPKWKDADGKDVESKVDLGRMGFFRGERNWLILLTPSEPLIFRVEDSQLKTVVPAIQEHTGVTIKR
jgi:hypothetical protein